MNKKSANGVFIGAAVAAILVVAVLIAAVVVSMGKNQGDTVEDLVEIEYVEPVDDTDQAAIAEQADDVEVAAPLYDNDAAIALTYAITSGANYTTDGWASIKAEADAIALRLDERSIKGAFTEYVSADFEADWVALASYNVGKTYERVSEDPLAYKITVSAKRATSPQMDGLSFSSTAKHVLSALKESADERYFVNVEYTLTVDSDGQGAILVCDTPDWYRAAAESKEVD